MKFAKLILTLLLLAVWLPATVHCGLESAGFLPMDECCETESRGTHRCDAGCNVIEDGGIKTEAQATVPAVPNIFIILPALCAVALPEQPDEAHQRPQPFRIHHLPQFVIRTALPIRGPSFAS